MSKKRGYIATVREFHQHALLTALILRPSTHFGYSNSFLSGCLWPWRLYFLGLNNWRDVFHTPKSDEYILVLCVALGHYEILACPLIPLLLGWVPHFHDSYCFAYNSLCHIIDTSQALISWGAWWHLCTYMIFALNRQNASFHLSLSLHAHI